MESYHTIYIFRKPVTIKTVKYLFSLRAEITDVLADLINLFSFGPGDEIISSLQLIGSDEIG